MQVQRHIVDITTATDGSATAYSPTVTGRIGAIVYTKDATTPLASTADVTITAEQTGEGVWAESNVNASKTVRPLAAAATPLGAASTLSELPIWVADDRVKIVIAQGGNTKTGRFQVIVL